MSLSLLAPVTVSASLSPLPFPIVSIMPELAPFLTDEELDEMTKIRLIMLYATLKNGMPESDVDKIFDCADLPMR